MATVLCFSVNMGCRAQ